MTTLTEKMAALQAQMDAQAIVTDGYIDELEEKIDGIYLLVDTINNNNSTNAQALLNVLSRVDPCPTCPPLTLEIPPLQTPQTTPSGDTCQRSNAFVQFMTKAVSMIDTASSLGTGMFFSLLQTAFSDAISSEVRFSSIPLISFPEGVQLVGTLINYAILNIGRGDTLSAQWATIKVDLIDVMAQSTSAANAQARYMNYIDATGLPADEKAAFRDVAYDGIFNALFDGAQRPDLTGFPADNCGLLLTVCDTSTGNVVNPDGTHNASWAGTAFAAGMLDQTEHVIFDQDAGDFTFTLVSGTFTEAVSFLKAGGGITTYPLPAFVPRDPARNIYARSTIEDCVVFLCIQSPGA